jgi:hypothetical protein
VFKSRRQCRLLLWTFLAGSSRSSSHDCSGRRLNVLAEDDAPEPSEHIVPVLVDGQNRDQRVCGLQFYQNFFKFLACIFRFLRK